jgi:predicted glutamine amidotransferase
MCQLLGMNCNVPTDICFSFTGFQARGGATDVHSDGWGIAFFEGKGTRVFLDPQPSCTSPVAELVRHYPIRSKNVIAHIRKATQGAVGLENTHPFMRELWGRYWIFAHNGNLLRFRARARRQLRAGRPDRQRARLLLAAAGTAPAFRQPHRRAAELFDAMHADAGNRAATANSISCSRTATACSPTPRPSWPTSFARRRLPRPT